MKLCYSASLKALPIGGGDGNEVDVSAAAPIRWRRKSVGRKKKMLLSQAHDRVRASLKSDADTV